MTEKQRLDAELVSRGMSLNQSGLKMVILLLLERWVKY